MNLPLGGRIPTRLAGFRETHRRHRLFESPEPTNRFYGLPEPPMLFQQPVEHRGPPIHIRNIVELRYHANRGGLLTGLVVPPGGLSQGPLEFIFYRTERLEPAQIDAGIGTAKVKLDAETVLSEGGRVGNPARAGWAGPFCTAACGLAAVAKPQAAIKKAFRPRTLSPIRSVLTRSARCVRRRPQCGHRIRSGPAR